MLKEFNVILDLSKHKNNPVYTFSTSDWQSLKFLVNVQKDGVSVDLTGITPRIAIKKTDKTTILQDGTVTDATNGKCEFLLTSQAYVVNGSYKAEVMLYEGTEQVATTSGFTYMVSIGVMDIELESKDDWPTLSKAIEAGENEPTRIAAEETRIENENVRITSEEIRQTNEEARQIVLANMETATENANTQALYAKGQGDYAKAEADRLVGTDVSTLDNKIGPLTNLTTTNKTSVVNAINEQATLLAQKAKQTDLDTTNANIATNTSDIAKNKTDIANNAAAITNIGNASPKGTYATLSALQTAFPAGTTGIYVVTADGKWYYWSGSAWAAGGTYQATALADGSFTAVKSGTSLGSMQDYVYINNTGYIISKSGTDLKVKFASGTSFTYRNIDGLKSVTLTTLEYVIPQNNALVLNLDTGTDLLIKGVGSITIKDKVLISSVYGRPVVNNMFKAQGDFNNMIFTQATIEYTNSSGTLNVTFSGDNRLFLKSGTITARQLTLSTTSYSIPTSNALVWNLYDNNVVVKSWDSLLPDDMVLLGNYNGTVVQDNLRAKASNDTQKLPQSSDDIIYYGGTITYQADPDNAGAVIVKFSQDGDKRLFLKKSNYNASYTLPQFEYSVPTSNSLVYNKQTAQIETVDSNTINYGKQLLLLSVHNSMVKKSNVRIENHIPELEAYTVNSNEKREIHWGVEAHQGMTIIDDYLLVFNESLDDHSNWGTLYILNKNDFTLVKTVQHNLGHVNACDYDPRTDRMIIGNNAAAGITLQPSIYIFNDARATFTQSTQIDFNTANKLVVNLYTATTELGNYGSRAKPNAAWGEEDNIVYLVMNDNKVIYRCFLGKGTNDLTTVGTYGTTTFGTFSSGKGATELNGTLRILGTYPMETSWGVNQGMAYYKGKILTATTQDKILTLCYVLKSNGKAKLADTYNHDIFDGLGNRITYETEDICISDGKLYQSFRSGSSGNGIIVTPLT
jgi:hypothetical protein